MLYCWCYYKRYSFCLKM